MLKAYFRSFLTQCDSLGLLNVYTSAAFQRFGGSSGSISTLPNRIVETREQKIENFRQEKELEAKIKILSDQYYYFTYFFPWFF